MKVELVEYTPNAEALCAAAMKLCHAPDKDSFIEMYKDILEEDVNKFARIKEFISLAIKLGHESVLEHASFTFIVEDPESFKNKIVDFVRVDGRFEELMGQLWKFYTDAIKLGIPLEDARFILPNACTTKIVITMNARELRHFFKLRCSKHAQWEIREMANRMLKLCCVATPLLFEDLYNKYLNEKPRNPMTDLE